MSAEERIADKWRREHTEKGVPQLQCAEGFYDDCCRAFQFCPAVEHIQLKYQPNMDDIIYEACRQYLFK